MPETSLHILIVDDDEEDFILTRDLLGDISCDNWTVEWAGRYEQALETILENRHDVCLIDYFLGQQTGLDLIREARVRGSDTPMILLTGKGDYELDVEAMKIGVADYLEKSQLTPLLLERSVRFAIERSARLDALKDSEKRFRIIADTAAVMIWMTDPEGECTFFNKSWLAFTGRRSEEEVGRGWTEVIHPDDRERCVDMHNQAVKAKECYRMEFRLRRFDGLYRWFLSAAVPRNEIDGSFAGYVGSCVDISDRRDVEDELRQARNYLQNIIDSSLDMIVTVDDQRRVVEFNEAAQKAFGYTSEEILGRPVTQLYAFDKESQRVHDLIEKSGSFTGEIINRRRNGEAFPSHLQASVLRNEDGRFLGVMGISRDITQQKQAEKQQVQMLEQIERSHDDMLSILNQLRQGIVMTDPSGHVTFLSQSCQQLIGQFDASACGRHWTELCPFGSEDKKRLEDLADLPPEQREKFPIHIKTPTGQQFWMEIELLDDPRDPKRKIFFIYDMTELHDLRRMLDDRTRFQDIIGTSEPMLLVYQQIHDLAAVDSTVLIEGDTGTGKELVARAIHDAGPRAGKAFVPVNTAGLTDSLIGSQLFGHRRGAFTGAVADHQGVFETANGGTIFLDEIGDVPMNVQTSLLRVLQEREITRLGESKPRKVDVRIIAATHKNLDEEVAAGRFRLDLLYRIRVARITLPPLNQRQSDIPLLAESFLRQAKTKTGKDVQDISDDAMQLLLEHNWPGNVRELNSAIEFAAIRSKDGVIRETDLPPELRISPHPTATALDSSVDIATDATFDPQVSERDRMIAALNKAKGNRTAAAKLLGISRATFYRRLEELEIDPH